MTPERAAIAAELNRLRQEVYALEKRLSGVSPEDAIPAGESSLLLGRVDRDLVGIPVAAVEAVVMRPLLTSLPEAPPWVPGLLNLRGRSIPVVDLPALWKRAHRPPRLTDRVVVCAGRERPFGLVVEALEDVVVMHRDELTTPTEGVAHAPYVHACFRWKDEIGVLIGLHRMVEVASVMDESQ